MKKPPIIRVLSLIGKDTFDTIEDGDALATAIYDSLSSTGYSLISFRGIRFVEKEAIQHALREFTTEKNSCRILIEHQDAESEQASAHFHLQRTLFPSKKKVT